MPSKIGAAMGFNVAAYQLAAQNSENKTRKVKTIRNRNIRKPQ